MKSSRRFSEKLRHRQITQCLLSSHRECMFAERNKRTRRLSVPRLLAFSSCRNRFTLYISRARRKHVLQLWPNKSVGRNHVSFFHFYATWKFYRSREPGRRQIADVGRDLRELLICHAKSLIRGKNSILLAIKDFPIFKLVEENFHLFVLIVTLIIIEFSYLRFA